jgi:hypothetical protein
MATAAVTAERVEGPIAAPSRSATTRVEALRDAVKARRDTVRAKVFIIICEGGYGLGEIEDVWEVYCGFKLSHFKDKTILKQE